MPSLTVKYFSWVRERVGRAEDVLDVPAGVTTIADLVSHLRARGEEYAYAFADGEVVRAALDRRHAPWTTPLAGAAEIAFFPPVTGG